MLTGGDIPAKVSRGRVLVSYLDVHHFGWQKVANWVLEVSRNWVGLNLGMIEQELEECTLQVPDRKTFQGLCKLFLDAMEFSICEPETLAETRGKIFLLASNERAAGSLATDPGVRNRIFDTIARECACDPSLLDELLYADLESEKRLKKLPDWSVERFLNRYNLALAQGVMLQARQVRLRIPGTTPVIKIRQLIRWLNFRRLLFSARKLNDGMWEFVLDGPLSLFRSTNKYGLQLALVLPALLLQNEYEIEADVVWGKQQKQACFAISHTDGLVSHLSDQGVFKPVEHQAFMNMFQKKIAGLEISDEISGMDSFHPLLVPDFVIKDRNGVGQVGLEILWSWNEFTLKSKLEQIARAPEEPYILAVHEKGNLGEKANLPANVGSLIWFKSTPLVKQVGDLAGQLLKS